MKKHFILMLLAYACIYGLGYYADTHPEAVPQISTFSAEIVGPREKVVCEFEEPIGHLTLINHWYDTNEEMFAEYLLAEPEDPEEAIWGWSSCMWQPEDDWAGCDMHLVKPDFVSDDPYIDTIGHEVFHGACGRFHE